MKIAFIVRFLPKLSETFILNQITGLLDLGHEVEVFAEAPAGNEEVPPEFARYGLQTKTHYFHVPEALLPRLLTAGRFLVNALLRADGTNLRLCLRALNVRRFGGYSLKVLYAAQPFLGRRFDILMCHYGVMGNLGAALKQIGIGRKLAVMFHGTDIREGIERGGAIYGPVFRQADAILAISKYNEENLLRFGARPETLVRHPVGIDVGAFTGRGASEGAAPSAPANHRADGREEARPSGGEYTTTPTSGKDGSAPGRTAVILTVARLTPVKGVDCGIRAVGELKKQMPECDVEYRIAGDGPQRDALRALAAELGLSGDVRFLGALAHENVVREMEAADLYLMPSRAEALPVALMEALCAGLPAVATRVGSTDEVLADGLAGFLVPPEDPTAMAGKLAWLLQRPESWAKTGWCGREHVLQAFDVRKLNERLVRIYDALLSEDREALAALKRKARQGEACPSPRPDQGSGRPSPAEGGG